MDAAYSARFAVWGFSKTSGSDLRSICQTITQKKHHQVRPTHWDLYFLGRVPNEGFVSHIGHKIDWERLCRRLCTHHTWLGSGIYFRFVGGWLTPVQSNSVQWGCHCVIVLNWIWLCPMYTYLLNLAKRIMSQKYYMHSFHMCRSFYLSKFNRMSANYIQ